MWPPPELDGDLKRKLAFAESAAGVVRLCWIKYCTMVRLVEIGEEEEEVVRVWEKVPVEVVEKIAAYLPRHHALQLAAVSREFQRTLASPEFQSMSLSVPVPGDLCFPAFFSDASPRHCVGLDLISRKWRKLPPLDFLPHLPAVGRFACWSSSAGRVCVQKDLCLYRCNPVTRRYRSLPGLPMLERPASLLAVLTDSRFPDVIYAVTKREGALPSELGFADGGVARVQMYDTRRGCWSFLASDFSGRYTGRRAVSDASGMDFSFSPLLVLNGVIYMQWCDYRRKLCCLMGYSVGQHVWDRVCVLDGLYKMVVCQGTMMLVRFKGIRKPRSFVIHRFDAVAGCLVEQVQGNLPGELFLKECYMEDWDCTAHGNVICIVLLQTMQVAAFDLETKLWQSLPPSPCSRNFLEEPAVSSLHSGFELGLPSAV